MKFRFSKRNKVIFSVGLIAIIIVTIAASYAFWLSLSVQTGRNLLVTGCFNVTFTEDTEDFTLTDSYPVKDENGKQAPDPYTFTVKNTCKIVSAYQINVEILPVDGYSPLNPEYVRVSLNSEVFSLGGNNLVEPSIDEATSAYFLKRGELNHQDEYTYELRLWMSEDTPLSEGQNKAFMTKISIRALSGEGITDCEMFPDSLTCRILSSTTIYKENPDFAVTPIAISSGMYSYPEEDGISYYFRGLAANVNNNVIFAGIHWKILRIDKTGNIKLIYHQPCPNGSCTMNVTANKVGSGAFIETIPTGMTNPGYTSTYLGVDIDSTMKVAIESWYKTNLYDKGYDSYIADVVYCNDRSGGKVEGSYIYYDAYGRLTPSYSYSKITPSLNCVNSEDKYTLSTVNGNGKLKYKVGVVTADEIVLTGITTNQAPYLYIAPAANNDFSWTMTSYYFTNSALALYSFSIYSSTDGAHNTRGYRPVIALSSTVKIASGDGSFENPYVILES